MLFHEPFMCFRVIFLLLFLYFSLCVTACCNILEHSDTYNRVSCYSLKE